MANVYISSTLADLRPEREAVRNAILRLGHQPLDSYTARDRRPLAACLEDVAHCQAYVGLLGWRYGSQPPGERRSYTELEFDEAGQRGIPRLIFLRRRQATSLDMADANTGAVRQFRQRAQQGRITAEFGSENELVVEVEDALRKELGAGEPVPPQLPWLADRSQQEEELQLAVTRWADRPLEPLVVVLHGDEYQGLNELEERLVRSLNALLPAAGGACPATCFELDWPRSFKSRDDYQEKLARKLALAVLDDPAAELGQLRQTLARFPGLVATSTQVLSEDYRARGRDVIDGFVAFWRGFGELAAARRLVAFLRVKYQLKTHLGWLKRRRYAAVNRHLAAHLEELGHAPGLAVLPQLGPVGRSEVDSWAQREEVRQLLRGRSAEPAIRSLFESWERERGSERIPMEELAQRLLRLLHRHNGLREEMA